MKIKFTEKSITSLLPEAKPYEAIDIQLPGFLVRIQPTGRQTYYYSYKTNAGKRVRLKLGRHGDVTLTQAREMAKATAGDIAKGKDPQQEKQIQRERAIRNQAMTLRVFIEEYYEPWVLKHNRRGGSNIFVLNRHFLHLMHKPIAQITAVEIERWQIAELGRTNKQGKPLKPATVNRRLTCLRAVFSRALATKHIEENPLTDVKKLKQEDDTMIRYLSKEEEERLYAALRHRHHQLVTARSSANDWRVERGYTLYPEFQDSEFVDHIEPMVLLAINTGLRKGEIFSLKWYDVNFEQKVITVRAANAKSRKVRHVHLNRRAMEVLSNWKKQQSVTSGWVFKSLQDNRFVDIKKAWQSVLESAGITEFRFHDLRHHFASKLVMRGAHLNTVRELLGHSDLSTTLRYAHLSPDHKAEAVALLDS
jgi:integrase